MRIEIYTSNPENLKQDIFQAVNENILKTWEVVISDNEKYLTHSPVQWKNMAFLYPVANEDKLTIEIYWQQDNIPDNKIMGYYLGRFSEILLVHFNDYYNSFETFYE